MKLKQIIPLLFLVFSSTCLIAQDKESTGITKEDFLKDLTKISMKDAMGKKMNKNVHFYDENGKKINKEELNGAMKSGDYTPNFYLDKEGQIKAIALSKVTEEEKKKREERREKIKSMKKRQSEELLGKDAIPFSVTDIEGNEYSLNSLKDKIIVLNFWFVQCEPCVREIPELNNLVEKYKDKDVVFIAFNALDDYNQN